MAAVEKSALLKVEVVLELVQFAKTTLTPTLAGSAAEPSCISGRVPLVLFATILEAIVMTSYAIGVEGGGMEPDANGDSAGYRYSVRACT